MPAIDSPLLDVAATGFPVLQPGHGSIPSTTYVPATPGNTLWGRLPCEADSPCAVVQPGAVVTVDTISHEGVLEDQGRDPREFFARYGVGGADVLDDAQQVADSGMPHDFDDDGPHLVTGPIAVAGARPGDLLAVSVLGLTPRVPYGLVSARHGFGALPGEMPSLPGPVMTFATAHAERHGAWGRMAVDRTDPSRGSLRFPLRPFLGVMGVAVPGSERPHSVPPGRHGGNIDVSLLGEGTTLFLPVQVDDALVYFGDPHFAQGDGEVALTAFEASLRATVKLEVVPGGAALRPGHGRVTPFAETDEHLVPIGLDEDLDEAMRDCVRCALDLLVTDYGIDRHLAMAYLSAAGDFAVSQVVDGVKGVHGRIRKSDFREVGPPR
ncbi:acetamidase/formamidase family protein [Streptomyces coeruleorubidus]|uniref:acetamidase/formamidase family protein n=1 Tax=Streptomyces coeruleorubidus TaxID=116188 RepID=UPI00237FB9D3|nr:acetamidase/formamidase family protein [Streptomyces coeruleorubidus]WDV55481.1 acetamidase/formamidase family protein [Streptomyces coeruleorubidus]